MVKKTKISQKAREFFNKLLGKNKAKFRPEEEKEEKREVPYGFTC